MCVENNAAKIDVVATTLKFVGYDCGHDHTKTLLHGLPLGFELLSQPQLLCITCSILAKIACFSSRFLRFYKIHKYKGLDMKVSKNGS